MTHLNLPEKIHGDLHKEPCINDGELPSAAKNDMELCTIKRLNDNGEMETINFAFKKFHNLSPPRHSLRFFYNRIKCKKPHLRGFFVVVIHGR